MERGCLQRAQNGRRADADPEDIGVGVEKIDGDALADGSRFQGACLYFHPLRPHAPVSEPQEKGSARQRNGAENHRKVQRLFQDGMVSRMIGMSVRIGAIATCRPERSPWRGFHRSPTVSGPEPVQPDGVPPRIVDGLQVHWSLFTPDPGRALPMGGGCRLTGVGPLPDDLKHVPDPAQAHSAGHGCSSCCLKQ